MSYLRLLEMYSPSCGRDQETEIALIRWMHSSARPWLLSIAMLAVGEHCCPAHSVNRDSNHKLARVSRVLIHRADSKVISPDSDEGLVIVALRECNISINEEPVTLHRGEFRQVRGKHLVTLGSANELSAELLLVVAKEAIQPLTIEPFNLKRDESVEDASDRNETLLIAISSIELRDTLNTKDESEWHPGNPHLIAISAGEFEWLAPGLHHLKNRAHRVAEFITIEW